MAITNKFISNEGECFTGTKAQLAREYGIKQLNGLTRPSGAVAEDGSRWLTEDEFTKRGFIKPTLWLINRVSYHNNKYLGVTTREEEGPSTTAANYCLARDILKKEPNHEYADDLRQMMATVEAQYELVGTTPTFEQEQIVDALRKDIQQIRPQKYPYLYDELHKELLEEKAKLDKMRNANAHEVRMAPIRAEMKARGMVVS